MWANAHFNIAIHPAHEPEHETAFNRHRVGLHHLAFRAHSRDDIDRFHEFLLSRAVVVLDPPREYPEYGQGYYALFFADPDGIKLELVHHQPVQRAARGIARTHRLRGPALRADQDSRLQPVRISFPPGGYAGMRCNRLPNTESHPKQCPCLERCLSRTMLRTRGE